MPQSRRSIISSAAVLHRRKDSLADRRSFHFYGSKCYTFHVTATAPSTFRVFASKPFMRFARRFGIGDEALWNAVNGPCDADLGGGVFKYRLARDGEGSSGGARALIAMKTGRRAVLMFGFEKKDQANIRLDELKEYRKAAKIYLAFSEEQIAAIVRAKALVEIAPSRGGARNGKSIQKRSTRGPA
jgi:hypothetical protein